MPMQPPQRRYSRRYSQKRAENRANWVNEPLQNTIREELDRRGWTISDLARQINSQPSLISRWMMGQRPNTESLRLVADALGISVLDLLRKADHIPADAEGGADQDNERLARLIVMLRQTDRDGYLSEDRYGALHTMLDWMRNNEPANAGVSNTDEVVITR